MRSVLIRGDGVAANCCAHLLGALGFHFTVERTGRPKLPALMLGETTQALFRDVFGRAGLFQGLPRIERRVVAWGPKSKRLTLPHSAVVVSEQVLLERLQTKPEPDDASDHAGSDWTILAARPLPLSSTEHHFGSRVASAMPVTLKTGSDAASCWVESLENGWLFLIPTGRETAWLLAVGGAPEPLLASSRLVVNQMEAFTSDDPARFPAYPRIAWPLCGPGWLACGTAALAFDPLCGEGTGHAIREGILASAAVRAVAAGAEREAVLAHYRARLLAGFKRHLEACRQFYETGGSGWWWNAELESVRQGIEWCGRELGSRAKFQFQLRGFELQPVK